MAKLRGEYLYLEKGDIIQAGDEVEMSNGWHDEPRWQTTTLGNVGAEAPDPSYVSHRKYRRKSSQ
jgi:hypothetical protein